QSRTVIPQAEARVLPSDVKAAIRTECLCSRLRTSLRLATSHSRNWWSGPPVARVVPSGENVAKSTEPGCGRGDLSRDVARSQNRTVLSRDPSETRVLPSGATARDSTSEVGPRLA